MQDRVSLAVNKIDVNYAAVGEEERGIERALAGFVD
jgi:hypothetical protein